MRHTTGSAMDSSAPALGGSGGPTFADGRRALWEDVLTLVADPDSPRVRDPRRARALLARMLARAGLDECQFWSLDRGRRGHLFLSRWASVERDLPHLELSAFDIEKLLKERYRREPLTIGAAWHHGFWRAYFSHAAITHPANDGLREEFSTAWDIVRKAPTVVHRGRRGRQVDQLRSLRLDMPLMVGPLPFSDGATMESAYLRAIAATDPRHDRNTRTLVIIAADRFLANAVALAPFAAHLMVRLAPRHLDATADGPLADGGPLAELLRAARIVELDATDPVALASWAASAHADEALALAVDAVCRVNPDLLVSVALRYTPRAGGAGGAVGMTAADDTTAAVGVDDTTAAVGVDDRLFWDLLAAAARTDPVALIHYHSGPLKSYRLTPRLDGFLKDRLLRARVQLLSAGGDTDTHASAATVYEAVLLGANGGAMTHAAAIPLAPEVVEALDGAGPQLVSAALAACSREELTELASCTLTCWQHSILDFLSCMGIDDIQKTSGNTMAITMTEDWVRQVDALATVEFGRRNAELNRERLAAEPVPPSVRERYKVSTVLLERRPDVPLVNAARLLAQRDVSFHAGNSSRALTADFLEVIYRMAAGEMPDVHDFFVAGEQGEWSLDGIRLKLSPDSVAWSLERLGRDTSLLDYVSLAVPRGFARPGAVPAGGRVTVHAAPDGPPLARFLADGEGGFEIGFADEHAIGRALQGVAVGLSGGTPLWLRVVDPDNGEHTVELAAVDHGAHGATVVCASADGAVTLRRDPRGGLVLSGVGVREPIWHGPVCHASTSLGAASEDFLVARVEGNAGITMTSSGEGGPIRPASAADWRWESLQAASGHFGITGADLRRVRDVEIKINQGAKPGKGGRLSGAKVTATVSRARNIPVGTDALSPDPKHDIYSIEDMPAEVWLWLMYHNYCGIKITGSNYTRYVAAGMWSNFVVDYLLIDAGTGGSGNYHADSSHVGWPDIFRTILHTHHALLEERVDLDGSGRLQTIRDLNGVPFGAAGGTRLLASGGLRGELDMIKVLIAGADALVEGSIGKAVAFGCNQCGNCHLDCPRGGITTKQELTVQNDRDLMRTRSRNWAVLNLVKLAVLVDALNRESGALDEHGNVARPDDLIDDIRMLRGRTDLLVMDAAAEQPEKASPQAGSEAASAVAWPPADGAAAVAAAGPPPAAEHDSCRVGSLAVSEPVTVHAIWEAARVSYNGGNNRGGGIDWAGFAPAAVADATCVVINAIGPDRDETMLSALEHFRGCRFLAADGSPLPRDTVARRLGELRLPVHQRCAGEDGWRAAGLRESPGDFYLFFVDLEPEVLARYGRALLAGSHWLQARTKYGDMAVAELAAALDDPATALAAAEAESHDCTAEAAGRVAEAADLVAEFLDDVRQEYFTVLAHIIDSRYYRTHGEPGAPAGKFSEKRRAHVVSIGEDLAAVKLSGWTHAIPEYIDFDRFWANYPGAADRGGVPLASDDPTGVSPALRAHVWGMHHRYPTNSPAIDSEGRGNPAGAHPFKAYNVLLMHNGEQVGVDSTSPFLREYGYVHTDPSMGDGAEAYEGDSVYDRKALTDTEYAAYLVDFTRRVLGLSTEEASQVISPITGLDLQEMPDDRRELLRRLSTNYIQLTPTGPYKFTIVESRGRGRRRRVGFRENMDIKFLRPHELAVSRDTAPGGVEAVANGSEAKIADAMLRTLRQQGVLADAGHDLRFSMRPGGNPGRGEFGGVVEAFVQSAAGTVGDGARDDGRGVTDRRRPAAGDEPRLDLRNRFGEPVAVERAGVKIHLDRPLLPDDVSPGWRAFVSQKLAELAAALPEALAATPQGRFLGPEDCLPKGALELVEGTLERLRDLSGADYRYLVEQALPGFALLGAAQRAAALRMLAELRKRAVFADLGGKALSSIDYLTDGGRDAQGRPEGGIMRVLDAVPPLHQALADRAVDPAGCWGRLTLATRDDLLPPTDPARDVLVVDFAGFASESFRTDCAARFVAAAVRAGWRTLLGYGFTGGPRYVGSNLTDATGASAEGVVLELFGRECGDFLGAVLEGAQIWLYGQGQSHIGMKAGSGSIFVLQDGLNTCCYAAHGGRLSIWDSGSRFAVAGQNRVRQDDETPAQGFQSIHFGSPNEYAFEYLMSGGENSLHVVLGLAKPDRRGELSLRARPYSGKFLMSGAAAGRVFVFDPLRALHPEQYRGNAIAAIDEAVWRDQLGPFIAAEAHRRGAPVLLEGDQIAVRLQGEWRRWRYDAAFIQLVPHKVARKAAKAGAVPPQLAQIVDE